MLDNHLKKTIDNVDKLHHLKVLFVLSWHFTLRQMVVVDIEMFITTIIMSSFQTNVIRIE